MKSLFFLLSILGLAYTQSLANIGVGLPDSWPGDLFGEFLCPSKNIPTFLDGYFLCQLSASYGNVSAPRGSKIEHMIDAIGAVGSFRIKNGRVTFKAKYYPSLDYKTWNFVGRDMEKSGVTWGVGFGYSNYAKKNLYKNLSDSNTFGNSPNVDFWKIGKQIIGGTEDQRLGYQFDVPTLSNFTIYPFNDEHNSLSDEVDTIMFVGIHEHVDPDGTIWAGFSAIGHNGQDTHQFQGLYNVDQQGNRKIAALYDLGKFDYASCVSDGSYKGDPRLLPGYAHSITATENYIIMPITSLLVSLCYSNWYNQEYAGKTIVPGEFGYTQWFPNAPFRFLIFDKRTKTWATQTPIEAPTMFVAHQLNAYEIDGSNLVADMITYPDASPYQKYLFRDFLTTQLYPNTATITRFNIQLDKNKVTMKSLTPQATLSVEFPQMNRAYRSKFYSWSYIVVNPYSAGNSILKLNVNDASGSKNLYYKAGGTIGLSEPVFVPNPNSKGEDDGVVLIRGLDVKTEKGLLLVVNAKTMTEIGRATVPISIPFGFHNKFFSSDVL